MIRMMILSPAGHVGGAHTQRHAYCDRDSNGDGANLERDAAAVDDSREDISAKIVRAERMPQRRRVQALAHVYAERWIGRNGLCENC